MQILVMKDKFLDFWRSYEDVNRLVVQVASRSVLVLLVAYGLASIASSVALVFISDTAMKHRFKTKIEAERVRLGKETNFRDYRKVIVGRNLFNAAGIVPDEPEPSGEGNAGDAFNPAAKCQKPSVNVELLGIIHTGSEVSSLATILEKGYTIADIYRTGDRIVGQDQALIFAIEEGRVVLNNNGVKECLEINSLMVKSEGSTPSPAAAPEPVAAPDPDAQGADCPTGTISLESSFVEDSLGPGFSKILETGRLVPFHRDNAMVGFKLIGVRGGSLWTKANLNSGDVITAVNGTSMAQPEKGFAIYEALQTDKQIRLEYLRGGKSPCNLSVEIK